LIKFIIVSINLTLKTTCHIRVN